MSCCSESTADTLESGCIPPGAQSRGTFVCSLVPEPAAMGGEASFNTLLEALVPRNRMSIQFLYGSAFFKSNFIYLFMAVLDLRCCVSATLWLVCAWASHCCGFSCGARALGCSGFRSCSSRAPEDSFNSCHEWALLLCGTWDLPRPGIKPVSPALAGGFFTTAPPGKPRSGSVLFLFCFLKNDGRSVRR